MSKKEIAKDRNVVRLRCRVCKSAHVYYRRKTGEIVCQRCPAVSKFPRAIMLKPKGQVKP